MKKHVRQLTIAIIFFVIPLLLVAGCASKPIGFNPEATGPQLIASPGTLRLGVARVVGKEIVFRGKGFQPGEKVMIVLRGAEKGNADIRIPIAFAETGDNSEFSAAVEKITKIMNILRADFGVGEKGTFVIISGPPLPTGQYQASATGYQSDRKAVCDFVLRPPGLVDRLKDWVGGKLGKIQEA